MKKIIIASLMVLSIASFSVLAQNSPKHEFRAAWVATVKNIDWPSKPGLSSSRQKDEFRRILDMHEMNGFNAIIVQIRPSSDAFYFSELEPWSRYLTGTSGKAPDPYYDPLTFMIDEAHNRNLEFHAWFNPYRAVVDMKELPEDSTNIFYRKPEWFVKYGNRMYFDPGIPEVRTYVTNIIKDVTKRYDIDAIHFDDYFYPYRIANVEFPDSVSFQNYGQNFTSNTKDDWRRANVNTVIKMLSDTIKSVKPWVKFGISPFGVWRNKSDDPRGSDSQAGVTNYDDLFADVLLWMDNDWIDYVIPQLYLHIDHPKLSFKKVMDWWNEQDYNGHIYIGHASYRIGLEDQVEAWMNPSEVPNQIRLTRKSKNMLGSAFYNTNSFFSNPLGITDTLRNELYKNIALVPPMPWLDSIAPDKPVNLLVANEFSGIHLSWASSDSTTKYFVIYRFYKNKLNDTNNAENILAIIRANSPFYIDKTVQNRKKYTYAISSLDRLYNESKVVKSTLIKRKR